MYGRYPTRLILFTQHLTINRYYTEKAEGESNPLSESYLCLCSQPSWCRSNKVFLPGIRSSLTRFVTVAIVKITCKHHSADCANVVHILGSTRLPLSGIERTGKLCTLKCLKILKCDIFVNYLVRNSDFILESE